MQPDSFLEDVTLQCLLQDEFGCANRSWGSSIIAGLDPFPFSAEEQVKITFRHVVNAIEVILIPYSTKILSYISNLFGNRNVSATD